MRRTDAGRRTEGPKRKTNWPFIKSAKTLINTLEHLMEKKRTTSKSNKQKTLSSVVYPVQCRKEDIDLYLGETKQPLHRRMTPHRKASSSGQDSAVHLHLKEKGHSFEDCKVHILDREKTNSLREE